MTAIGTLPVVLGTGVHASRPAASAVGKGGLYSCTTHSLVYQTDGSSWSTWATLGSAASGSITASGYTQNTSKLLGRTTGSSGAIEEISVGSGLTFSAGSLSASAGGNYVLLTDTLLGGDTATFDFTSISGSYKHLELRCSVRGTDTATNTWVKMNFNNDTGSNYDGFAVQFFSGYTNGAVNEDLGTTSFAHSFYMAAASSQTGDVGVGIIRIPDYASTTFNKGFDADGYLRLTTSTTNVRRVATGGNWRSTAAISRITLTPTTGSFKSGSRVSLYGIS